MKKIIELIKSLFKKGSLVEKVAVIKQLDKEAKKIVPVKKKPVKSKKK
jgi:hypothetical protein